MKRESHAMLAHQTKQVTFLLPKIGTQNETLDSNIEEGCEVGTTGQQILHHGGVQRNLYSWTPAQCMP